MTSPTKSPFAAQPQRPLGTRPPPRPDVPLIIVRLVFAALGVLLLAQGPLLTWARGQPTLVTLSQHPPTGFGGLWHRLLALVGTGLRATLTPPGVWGVGGLIVIGLLVMAGELVINWMRLAFHLLLTQNVGTTCYRIRIPQPTHTGSAGRSAVLGDDLFRALHHLVPQRSRGVAWLALTLSARPDEPVTWGAVISGGTAKQRTSWGAALRKLLSGLDAGALVDEQPDTLRAAAAPGAVVRWREYGVTQSPAYPLRLPGDATTDVLGPLVGALRGRPGVVYSEYSLIVRPRHDWHLTAGWRVYALRRLLQLQAKQQYHLSPDVQALQDKLHSPAYDVTVRVTVVARDQTQLSAAQAELDEIGTALVAQYQARSGVQVQRLTAIAEGGCHVLPLPPRGWRGRLPTMLTGLLGAATMTGALWYGGAAWLQTWTGRLTILSELPFGASLAPRLLAPVLIIEAALLGSWCVRRIRGAGRWAFVEQLLRRPPRPTPTLNVLLPMQAWRAPSILGAVELAGLWHLPTPAMGTLVRWLPCRFLPAPPHAFTAASDAAPRADPRIIVGHALRGDGSAAPVGPHLRDLRQMLHLTAGMGAGKSRLLANICQQLIPHGFILADGKGDDEAGSLVATVRHLIGREAEARLVILDVLDTDWPIGINPLAGIDLVRPGGVDMALGQVLAIFGRLDPEVWAKSMGMQQYIRMGALLTLEAEPHPTMAHIKQSLVDEHYRTKLLERCTNIEVRTFWEVTFQKTGEQQRMSLDALLRRFDNLLATETTRYLLTQPLSTFEFQRAMDDGLIVLVPMPDMTLGGMASLVGMLALQAIVRAAFQRRGSDQSRTTYPLIVDEFQVFLNAGAMDDVSTAMTRLRSLGIGGIYAHQSLTQLGDFKDVMLINAQSRIVLKTQEPDASAYGRQYAASGLTGMDIANQDANEHQYAVLQCGGQTAGPLSMRPLAWPQPLAVDVDVPPAPAATWRSHLPPNTEAADTILTRIVHGSYSPAQFQRVVAGLAQIAEDEWYYLMTRWRAISAAQRTYILDHPGCLPDRLERQMWLSRLQAALPRVLVAAAYQRQRWMVTPGEAPARVAPPRPFVPRQPIGSGGRVLTPPAQTWGSTVQPAAAPVTAQMEREAESEGGPWN